MVGLAKGISTDHGTERVFMSLGIAFSGSVQVPPLHCSIASLGTCVPSTFHIVSLRYKPLSIIA